MDNLIDRLIRCTCMRFQLSRRLTIHLRSVDTNWIAHYDMCNHNRNYKSDSGEPTSAPINEFCHCTTQNDIQVNILYVTSLVNRDRRDPNLREYRSVIFSLPLSKLYTNSLISTLNAPKMWEMDCPSSVELPNTSLMFAHNSSMHVSETLTLDPCRSHTDLPSYRKLK